MTARASPTELKLLSIVLKETPGREVARQYLLRFGQRVPYGTLYTLFRRLRERGWVTVREDSEGDARVRYFKITASGVKSMRATIADTEFLLDRTQATNGGGA